MTFSRVFLKIANFVVSLVVFLALFAFGAFAVYALWDNEQVYSAVADAKADMLRLKPTADDADATPSFDQLLKINPDVCAWLTLDNTEIDYPVVRGTDNLHYVNTDVFGDYALSGSIFLDCRNSRDFSDPYSVLYGHHMANHLMFGDLDLYKDPSFFAENPSGRLLLPDGEYDLDIFACLLVNAGDNVIFNPTRRQTGNTSQLLQYVRDNALNLRSETLDALAVAESPRVLALTTCASEFTDARTIVLAAVKAAS